MKKLLSVVLCFCIVFAFAGCSENKKYNTEENSEKYLFEQDHQSYIEIYSTVAKSENGYYYIDLTDSCLHFYDENSKKSNIMCNKKNCTHNDDKCTAYLSPLQYRYTQLEYYNNCLYLLGSENSKNGVNKYYIYEISLESLKRKKSVYLFSSSGQITFGYLVHRGYVYYSDYSVGSGENTVKLYRKLLGTGKKDAEIIYEYTGNAADISHMNAYANNIIISVQSFANESRTEEIKNTIVCVNIHTKQSKILVENMQYPIAVYDNKVYFQSGKTNNTISSLDISTKETKQLFAVDEYGRISLDDNCLYINDVDKNVVAVYDKQGNKMSVYTPKKETDICVFGFGSLFFESSSDDGSMSYYIADTSNLNELEEIELK